MAQARTADQAAGLDEAGCHLTCDCWDCRAWRRHLLRLSVVVILACGLGGEVARQRGWWSGAPAAGAVEVGPAPEAWF